MGPSVFLKGVCNTIKFRTPYLAKPPSMCLQSRGECDLGWEWEELWKGYSQKLWEKRRDNPGRAISHIHQGGQKQTSRADPTLAKSQSQAQWREDHQAKPCHNCYKLGCFLPGRTRATILLPPLTVSHHQRDQQLGKNPNKWKTVLPPCHSFIFSFSLLLIYPLSLLFYPSPSLFSLSLCLVPSLPPLLSFSLLPSIVFPFQFIPTLCCCIYSITFYFRPIPEPQNVGKYMRAHKVA